MTRFAVNKAGFFDQFRALDQLRLTFTPNRDQGLCRIFVRQRHSHTLGFELVSPVGSHPPQNRFTGNVTS